MKKIIFCLVMAVSGLTAKAADCADDMQGLDGLSNADFTEVWQETTANDGKPMLIKMSDRNDKLYSIFEKTREGVWAEGAAEVCKISGGLEVRMDADDIKLGAKAPGLVKMAMRSGAKFRVQVKSARSVHVKVSGWSGDFVPKD